MQQSQRYFLFSSRSNDEEHLGLLGPYYKKVFPTTLKKSVGNTAIGNSLSHTTPSCSASNEWDTDKSTYFQTAISLASDFTYLDAFCQPHHFPAYLPEYEDLDALKAHYQRGGLGDGKVKQFLLNVLEETLAPIRERRKEFEKDIPAIYEMLRKGTEEARAVAAQTLDEVRRAMKINYFDDQALIDEQAKRFATK